MDLVEIDIVGVEMAQAALGGGEQIVAAVIVRAHFRSDKDLVPPLADGFGDQLFRETAAISFRRVDKGYAAVYRPLNGRYRVALFHRAQLAGNRPRPKSKHRDLWAILAKFTCLHSLSSCHACVFPSLP